MISQEQKCRIAACMAQGQPFAAFQHPGEGRATLLTPEERTDTEFFACEWAEPMARKHTIYGCGDAPAVWAKTTSQAEHEARVAELTQRLRSRGHAKTVLSATHCSPCTPQEALEMACRLFANSKAEFCSFYSLPGTGMWLGATPELLLSADASGRFSTMALAGTMPAGQSEWSQKNVSEHRAVASYIEHVLEREGIEFAVSPMRETPYGNVKHLRTDFEGTLPDAGMAIKLIDALNPTPALCGYPPADALADIASLEDHPRRCYGGIAGTIGPEGTRAYVNIRCAHIGQGIMCAYSGGGIMPDSDPAAEWAEANAKRAALMAMLHS